MLVDYILNKEIRMNKEEILKARKVCHFHLMRCSKEKVIECFLDVMEKTLPEKLIRIAERAREEIRI